MFLFLISIVSAIEVYSGESHSIVIREPYEFYSIVGNSSQVDLTVELDGLNAIITFGNYTDDEFAIIFFNSEKEIITVYSGGGGGSSTTKWKTKYVDRNVTEYVDKEIIKEVPGETIEGEKIPSTSGWTWFFGICLFILLIGLIIKFFFFKDITERG